MKINKVLKKEQREIFPELYRTTSGLAINVVKNAQFAFNRTVAQVFDDMALRSIPGYFTTQQLCINLAKVHAQQNSYIFDIGSATGTTLVSLAQELKTPNLTLVGVEPSKAMREQCQLKIAASSQKFNIPVRLDSSLVENINFSNTSLIFINYTLHFIPSDKRLEILKNIYKNLLPGGLLVLAEKVCGETEKENEILRRNYHRFKRLNGYSLAEVLDKEQALKGMFEPLTISKNIFNLSNAGFSHYEIAFEAPPFATFIAWK
jgi:tRNA (cmo5U34)-methyltransferase